MLPHPDALQLEDEYLEKKHVMHRYKIGASTVYEWINKYGFPKPYRLGPKLSRWKLSECVAWERDNKRMGAL